MYTLLPHTHFKSIRREYHIRFGTLLVLAVAVGVIIGAVAIVPSYILSLAQEKAAIEDLNTIKKARSQNGSEQVEKDLAGARTLVNALQQHRDAGPLSLVVGSMVRHRGDGITLSSFQVGRGEATSSAQVSVVGLASTRSALLSFKKALESDPQFSKVELPVSDLAQSKNIRFTVKAVVIW